ncbi:aldehyde dehydrogenase family protein [Streptomyces sp. NPDC056983]|uniref:aldehyde dehydrogenase family protein n=1 Tax=Streptomyces sp. NPDC056983 TaxID=3345987 RepID=UPI0036274BD4
MSALATVESETYTDVDWVTGAAGCHVDGRWLVGDGPEIRAINPSTGRTLALIPSAGREQVDASLAAARRTFEQGEWSRLTGRDRGALLDRLADLIERDGERLVRLAATELGSPVRSGRGTQIGVPVMFLRWFAEAARRGPRDGLEEGLPLHHDPVLSGSLLVREPAGVVAAVTAYNVPIYLAALKLGPALAAGCSAVLVPSPKALLCNIALVKLIEEAGFPPGAVNLVFGPPAVTEQVVTAREVDLVSFTGSATIGSRLMELAAPSLKKVVLELGGKSPNILLPGADIRTAVGPSTMRFCINAGQRCGATTRQLIPESSFDEFVEESATFMRSLHVGDPHDETTVVGPLIRDEHRRDVEGYLARAAEAGAKVATGGGRPTGLGSGFYLEPTLLTGISNEAEINQEELFAPVASVIPYRDLDDAVRIANQTKYGLNANVWGPTADAIALGRRLRSGTVTVNGGGGKRDDVPWGGFGASGLGREGGEDGYREFFEVKHIQWPI